MGNTLDRRIDAKKVCDELAKYIFLVAFIPYVIAIVTGKATPSAVTWGVWLIVDALALLGMRAFNKNEPDEKKKLSLGQITGATIGAGIIFTLSIFFGNTEVESTEWTCLGLAAAGIILWQYTGNPVLAIICSCIALLAGAWPTFVNVHANPGLEDPFAWSIWMLSCVFALLAVRKWSIEDAAQPITFTLIEGTMVFLVVIRPLLMA